MTTTKSTVNTPVINVSEVFEALAKWINRKPGLEFANYGEMTSYRAELRSIAGDKKRAVKALDEARSLEPARPGLLADAFTRAYSGRLSWVPAPSNSIGVTTGLVESHLEYTTGQYWPTEYRKAAATVLETYIRTWKQAETNEKPRTYIYHSMSDVMAANAAIGNCWFDRSTMRYFKTKIETGLIAGHRFITSERREGERRRYTIRDAAPDGSVNTVGEF